VITAAQQEFSPYGPSHLAVLAVFVIGAVALVWAGRTLSEEKTRLVGRAVAVALVVMFCVALVYKLIRLDIQTSIPIQLCDIAELMAAYALWTQRHTACAITYYWGLFLSSQALLTPDIGTPTEGAPDFPHHLFVTFFALHVLVVWAAIYVTWGLRTRPTWRDFRFTVAVTMTWVALTFTFNVIAGTNYGYLNAKPAAASVLDLLGPWPVYAIIEVIVVIGIWALMTWPWQRGARRTQLPAQEA
jgi:hypothetical integral membrane protein (TIGR02206 family)